MKGVLVRRPQTKNESFHLPAGLLVVIGVDLSFVSAFLSFPFENPSIEFKSAPLFCGAADLLTAGGGGGPGGGGGGGPLILLSKTQTLNKEDDKNKVVYSLVYLEYKKSKLSPINFPSIVG